MFRATSAHLQEDIVVNMKKMVLSLSMRVHDARSEKHQVMQCKTRKASISLLEHQIKVVQK